MARLENSVQFAPIRHAKAQTRETAQIGQNGANKGSFKPKTPITELLVRLSECESQRRTDIKVLDSDGYYSYGLLQFHRRTLEMFAKRYGLRTEITEADLYNPNLQMAVAKRMIEEDWNNWYQWYNCAKITGII